MKHKEYSFEIFGSMEELCKACTEHNEWNVINFDNEGIIYTLFYYIEI